MQKMLFERKCELGALFAESSQSDDSIYHIEDMGLNTRFNRQIKRSSIYLSLLSIQLFGAHHW
jgi:hypothetical protein